MTSARRAHWSQKVDGVAPHACKAERRAEDAERAMQAAALIRFLSPDKADTFDAPHSGTVSSPSPSRTGALISSRCSRNALWSCWVNPLS